MSRLAHVRTPTLITALLLALVALADPVAQAQQKPAPAQPAPAQPAPAQPAPAQQPDARQQAKSQPPAGPRPDRYQALLEKADAIARDVVKLRGLPLKHPIKRGVMQKQEIEKRLLERIDDEYSPEELAAEELAMKRLGLIPAAVDYKKLVIDLLTDQIAGFYDPLEGQLYIAGWQDGGLGPAGDDMVMSHEITHALQDQHFDLRAFMKPDRQNGDASVGRQALVEGDGTALMMEYVLSRIGMGPPWHQPDVLDMMGPQMTAGMATGKLGEAPLVLRESLLFPYLGGLRFVAYFRKSHAWARIDEIYRKPPLSTEQVLHPEKYESYERPVRITATDLPSLRGHRLAYQEVNGELGLAIFLRQHALSGSKARDADEALRKKTDQAAAGWGGDRLAIYTPPGHDGTLRGVVGVSYIVWDQPADALEFFDVLSDVMPAISGNGEAVQITDDDVVYTDAAGVTYLAQRKGDAVVLIVGASKEQAPAVLADVWKRWRVQRK
jgi:hypothetical protein